MPRGPKPSVIEIPLLQRYRLRELARSQQVAFLEVRRARHLDLFQAPVQNFG